MTGQIYESDDLNQIENESTLSGTTIDKNKVGENFYLFQHTYDSYGTYKVKLYKAQEAKSRYTKTINEKETTFLAMGFSRLINCFALDENSNTDNLLAYCEKLSSVPYDVGSKIKGFARCISISGIPSSFNFESVNKNSDLNSIFSGCNNLRKCPKNLKFNNRLKNYDLYAFFSNCSKLTNISGFQLPSSLLKVDNMFAGCSNLSALPEDFTLSGLGNDAKDWSYLKFINGTAKLTELPDKFMISNPDTTNGQLINANQIGSTNKFCNALEYLPSAIFYGFSNKIASFAFFCGSTSTISNVRIVGFKNNECIMPVNCSASFAHMFSCAERITAFPQEFTLRDIYPYVKSGANNSRGYYDTFFGLTGIVQYPNDFSLYDEDRNRPVSDLDPNYLVCEETFAMNTSLTKLPPNFKVPKHNIKNFNLMFANDYELSALCPTFTLSGNNTVTTDANMMFIFCEKLETLNNFSLPKNSTTFANINAMFYNCKKLVSLPNGFEIPASVSSIVDVQNKKKNYLHDLNMQKNTQSQYENFSTAGTSYIYETMYSGIFEGCSSLQNVDHLKNRSTKIGNYTHMFKDCTALSSLGSFLLSGNPTSCMGMFAHCESLSALPTEFRIPDSVQWMNYDFTFTTPAELNDSVSPSASLSTDTNNKISSWDDIVTLNTYETRYGNWGMFSDCYSLSSLPNGFNLPTSGKNACSMFKNCIALTGANLTIPEGMYNGALMFNNCSSIEELNLTFLPAPSSEFYPETISSYHSLAYYGNLLSANFRDLSSVVDQTIDLDKSKYYSPNYTGFYGMLSGINHNCNLKLRRSSDDQYVEFDLSLLSTTQYFENQQGTVDEKYEKFLSDLTKLLVKGELTIDNQTFRYADADKEADLNAFKNYIFD